MSVEEQLSNAVQACNNLTAAINGKVAQIDQKVDAATNAVPEKVQGYMEATVYVKASGEDVSDPRNGWNYRTIKGAVEAFPAGSYIKVVLEAGNHDIGANINVLNKYVLLTGAGKLSTTVTFKKKPADVDPAKYDLFGFMLNRSYIHTAKLTYKSDLQEGEPVHYGHPYTCPMTLNYDSAFSFSCCAQQAIDGIFSHFASVYPNSGTFGKFAANSVSVAGKMLKGFISVHSGAHIAVVPTGLAMSATNEGGSTAPIVYGDIQRDTSGKALNVFGIEV
ncbi:hypothetical protein ACUNME_003209 [Vibrio cholerae]